jgi:hypothetical protein
LSPRSGSTITWTGSELVVFGGNLLDQPVATPSNEGASFDPVQGAWEMTAALRHRSTCTLRRRAGDPSTCTWSLDVDPRTLLGFEDVVMGLDEDAEPPDDFHFPLTFTGSGSA